MSQRQRRYGDQPAAAVSDSAPVSRGTAARPVRFDERPAKHAGDSFKSLLDSGFDSGCLHSSESLASEALSSHHSLASERLEPRCPKEVTSGQLDSGFGLELSDRLSGPLSQLALDDQKAESEEERAHWQEQYVETLREAFQGDDDGDTHLHLAIIYGFRSVAECLIRLVPHPHFLSLRNSYMQTPLHLSVLTGDATLVRHLLAAGADASLPDRHGNTPLHLACQRADRSCVHALTEPISSEESRQAAARYACQPAPAAGTALDQWNYQGLSCLHIAVLSRDVQIAAHLICHGANVNVLEGKSGRTPLLLAAEAGNIEMLRFLAEACQADVDATGYGGLTAYQLALLNARLDVAELLLLLGAARRDLPDSDMDTSSDSDSEELLKPEEAYTDIRLRGQPLVAAQ